MDLQAPGYSTIRERGTARGSSTQEGTSTERE